MSGDDCPDNRTPKDNHTPAVNGCGPQGGLDFVPDDYGQWSFTEPCNGHDRCYGTCGSDKATCDSNFQDDMDEVCRQTTFFLSAERAACMRLSRIYAGAVSNFGDGPYEEGQIESCDCCEPPGCIFCNCNDTYYQSFQIAQCLDECHVSLGCFTGICEPAECP
jgi:secretory phospholipase A2